MGVPLYHGDFYSDDFILNPTQGYADLRVLGPVGCSPKSRFDSGTQSVCDQGSGPKFT